MQHVNPDKLILDLLAEAFGPTENQAAYNFFDEQTAHIWHTRPLTTEECEHYAQLTADKFGLDWKWVEGSGLTFTAKAS